MNQLVLNQMTSVCLVYINGKIDGFDCEKVHFERGSLYLHMDTHTVHIVDLGLVKEFTIAPTIIADRNYNTLKGGDKHD